MLVNISQKIWYYFLFIMLIFAFAAHTNFFQIQYLIAQYGFSVLEAIGVHEFPENFIRDFPGGSGKTTSSSILTLLYPPMQNLTGASGLSLMVLMIGVEIVWLAAGSLILWRFLVKESNDDLRDWGYLWLLTVLLLSNVTNPNLANFSFPYFHGQFYGFADALRLAAIAFALSRKWKWVAFCLIFGFAIHPIKTLIVGIFILATTLVDWRLAINRSSLVWGTFCAVVCMGWAYFQFGLGARYDDIAIPPEEFVAYTRIFQMHWYPNDLGLWSSDHGRALTPFMGLMLMSLIAISQCGWSRLRMHQFLVGMATLLLVTIFGFWVSVDQSTPSLIRLCLLRASTLMTLIAPFIILSVVVEKWRSKQWHWVAIYGVFILEGFQTNVYDMAPGLALVAVVLHLWEQKGGAWWLVIGALITLCLSATLWVYYPAVNNPFMLLLGQGLLILIVWGSSAKFDVLPFLRILAATLILFFHGLHWGYTARHLSDSVRERASNFMEIQLWANQNTEHNALFMVDPCQYYGWRDFSLRASLGTPREWYFSAWGYGGSNTVFQRGKAIGESLGLDMSKHLAKVGEQQVSFTADVCADAQVKFYDPERIGLTNIVKRFGVDYFIMLREKALAAGYTAKPAVQNRDYIAFKAKDIIK